MTTNRNLGLASLNSSVWASSKWWWFKWTKKQSNEPVGLSSFHNPVQKIGNKVGLGNREEGNFIEIMA